MKQEEIIDMALTMAKQREKECPTLPMYNSIVEQLKFLVNYLGGIEKDRSKLSKLMFGVYVAKELNETDPEFANILAKAYYIATQKRKGLKVDESILNKN